MARIQQLLTRPISPWWTVIAGGFAVAVGAGIVTAYMWGIFSKAIVAEFHWDRSTPALCLAIFLFATGFGSVSFGIAIARYGVRRSTGLFVALFGITVAAVGLLPNSAPLFYLVFAIMGVSGIAATAMPYAVAITGWFDSQRGLALGLMMIGSGIGAVLAPLLANHLVAHYGWRAGFLIVAAIVTAVPIVGLLFMVREPARPASRPSTRNLQTGTGSPSPSYVSTREFWLIGIPVLGVSIATIGVLASLLVPLLTDRGFSSEQAAAILSVAGFGSWVGRVGVGYAMDKVFAPYVTAAVLILTLCGVVLVALNDTSFPIMLGAALIGLGLGSEADIVAFLVSRYFHFDIYSKALGAMWIMWAWGGGLGTYIAGVSYDLTHSYNTSLGLFAVILLLSAIMICRLGPYRYPHAGKKDDLAIAEAPGRLTP